MNVLGPDPLESANSSRSFLSFFPTLALTVLDDFSTFDLRAATVVEGSRMVTGTGRFRGSSSAASASSACLFRFLSFFCFLGTAGVEEEEEARGSASGFFVFVAKISSISDRGMLPEMENFRITPLGRRCQEQVPIRSAVE